MKLRKDILVLAAATLLLGAFLVQGRAFIRVNSQTFDEATHLAAGYSYLASGQFRLNLEHPPFSKELAALPLFVWHRIPFDPDPNLWEKAEAWAIGRDFLYHSGVPHDEMLALGRWPNLVLGAVLIGLTGWWGFRLWGRAAALVAMALACLDPNLIAHSCTISPDLGITLFTLSTLYLLWEYAASPSFRLLLAVGMSLGLALATKYSALILVPIVIAVLGLQAVFGGSLLSQSTPPRTPVGKVMAGLLQAQVPVRRIFLFALATVAVIYFLYGFVGWGAGLRLQVTRPAAPAYFLGENSFKGWWAYYPVAFLIKTPLSTLFMVVASLALFRWGTRLGWREANFLLLPPALFFAAMVLGRVNNGIRYVLPIYPFLFVLAARLATVGLGKVFHPWLLTSLILALPLAWTAVSSWRIAPHQLAYFNELVDSPDDGRRYLGDSNLDWGQGLMELQSYMEHEAMPMIYLSYFGTAPPAAYGILYQHVPGFFNELQQPPSTLLPIGPEREILAISVTNLQGTYFPDPERYSWLEDRTPIAKIGYSIFIYDLTGDADAHERLAEVYSRAGLHNHAARERDRVRRTPSASR